MKTNFTIKLDTIIERAIYHDETAFAFWNEYKESGNDTFQKIWLEHTAKRNAMLEILDFADTSHLHYIVGGKLVEELIA